jgi:circadian clock protein KaiC
MKKRSGKAVALPPGLEKAPTGIRGLDEITEGGLPKSRPTLVCGSTGTGKTILGVEFLVHGATDFNEPGVLMAFEETEDDLMRNVASLGIDLRRLVARKKLRVDAVQVERGAIKETGEFDLGGLFIRLGEAIDTIGAKRVVLDTVEVLFARIENHAIVRAELRRLFWWLKEKGVTALITAEPGNGTLTQYGLEEYVADCVISLDQRVHDQVSTRRLRIVKYRGSTHGTNEYPFIITKSGVVVYPVTSVGLNYSVSNKRVSSGVPRLDAMLGGLGYYRGSTILISGSAGTGKSTLAAAFVAAACQRGERCLYVAFDEASGQILRNMRSVGIHLEPLVKAGLLQFHTARPSSQGLESHLATIHDLIVTFEPSTVIMDPINNLDGAGALLDVGATLGRLIDFLKMRQTTMLCTSLTEGGADEQQSEVGISSLMDTWLLVRNIENNGERNRALYVLKSRGMAHSNQVREYVLTNRGIQLIDVYTGRDGVVTGSARVALHERERVEEQLYQQDVRSQEAAIERRRTATIARMEVLKADLAASDQELKLLQTALALRGKDMMRAREELSRSRMADTKNPRGKL